MEKATETIRGQMFIVFTYENDDGDEVEGKASRQE